jgi:hypothetical protein
MATVQTLITCASNNQTIVNFLTDWKRTTEHMVTYAEGKIQEYPEDEYYATLLVNNKHMLKEIEAKLDERKKWLADYLRDAVAAL